MNNPQKYRIFWFDCAERKQVRSFYTRKQMNTYVKTQCSAFHNRIKREVWNGKKYERFTVIGGKLCTCSELRTELAKLMCG